MLQEAGAALPRRAEGAGRVGVRNDYRLSTGDVRAGAARERNCCYAYRNHDPVRYSPACARSPPARARRRNRSARGSASRGSSIMARPTSCRGASRYVAVRRRSARAVHDRQFRSASARRGPSASRRSAIRDLHRAVRHVQEVDRPELPREAGTASSLGPPSLIWMTCFGASPPRA